MKPLPDAKALADAHREYFAHLDEVFIAFTGSTPQKFADTHEGNDFGAALRALGRSLAENPEVGRKRNADGLEDAEEICESPRSDEFSTDTRRPSIAGFEACPRRNAAVYRTSARCGAEHA